jgi:hypothetical protein
LFETADGSVSSARPIRSEINCSQERVRQRASTGFRFRLSMPFSKKIQHARNGSALFSATVPRRTFVTARTVCYLAANSGKVAASFCLSLPIGGEEEGFFPSGFLKYSPGQYSWSLKIRVVGQQAAR